MKKNILLSLLFLHFCFYGCNNEDEQATTPTSENDIDAARNFIRASLNGDYDKAKSYMLKDSANNQFFDAYERNFTTLDGEQRRDYRNASLNIHQVKPVNDSVTIIIYSNSYKKDHDTLKVIRLNNEWLVDFKYLFQHDMDTLQTTLNKTDTAK
jgi:hypothetical protein